MMRSTLAILSAASLAFAEDWAAFGAKAPGALAIREAAPIFGAGKRAFGPDTGVEANSTRSGVACEADDVVNCEGGLGGCCEAGAECCGGIHCCGEGFKCGVAALGICCRSDQEVCSGNGCYSPDEGETCCGILEICSKDQTCCGLQCCNSDEVCDRGALCVKASDIDTPDDEDECCAASGCCPAGSHCHEKQCVPNSAVGFESLGWAKMMVLVGGLLMWNL